MTTVLANRPVAGDAWPAIERFVEQPAAFLPPPAHELRDGRWRSGVRAGPLQRGVLMHVGEVVVEPDAWSRPVEWVPTRGVVRLRAGHPLLPDFAGRMTLSQDGDTCRLRVAGTYTPPLGRLGALVDAWSLQRVAQRTIDAVADEVSARLSAPPGGEGPS